MEEVQKRKRRYERPDLEILLLETGNCMLAASVVVVTEVPITIQEEEVTLEEYKNGFEENEFKDISF